MSRASSLLGLSSAKTWGKSKFSKEEVSVHQWAKNDLKARFFSWIQDYQTQLVCYLNIFIKHHRAAFS